MGQKLRSGLDASFWLWVSDKVSVRTQTAELQSFEGLTLTERSDTKVIHDWEDGADSWKKTLVPLLMGFFLHRAACVFLVYVCQPLSPWAIQEHKEDIAMLFMT